MGEVLHQSQQLASVRKQYCLHSTSRTSGQDHEMNWREVGPIKLEGGRRGWRSKHTAFKFSRQDQGLKVKQNFFYCS